MQTTMKRFLESSSSEEDEDEQGMGGDECGSSNIQDEVDHSYKEYKKVEADLSKYVYEPVHFVRAHCKPEEKPSAEVQVRFEILVDCLKLGSYKLPDMKTT